MKSEAVMPVETARLELVPATIAIAQADIAGPAQLAQALNARIPPEWPPELMDDAAQNFVLNALTTGAQKNGWSTWFFLLKESRILIGVAGFVGPPSPSGEVVFGYGLLPPYHGQGLAYEGCCALTAWAFAQGASVIVADTLPSLTPSQRLLGRLGFVLCGAGPEEGTIRFRLERTIDPHVTQSVPQPVSPGT